MNIQISNQKPALLYFASKVLPNIPVITDESTYNSDRRDAISKMMVEPIFEPIVPNVPVDIIDNTDPKNTLPITSDMVSDAINSLWIDDTLDVDTDAQVSVGLGGRAGTGSLGSRRYQHPFVRRTRSSLNSGALRPFFCYARRYLSCRLWGPASPTPPRKLGAPRAPNRLRLITA